MYEGFLRWDAMRVRALLTLMSYLGTLLRGLVLAPSLQISAKTVWRLEGKN
jgi:hypothetical protein